MDVSQGYQASDLTFWAQSALNVPFASVKGLKALGCIRREGTGMMLSTRCLSALAPQLTFWEDKDGQLALVLDVLCEPKHRSGTC